MRCILFRLRTGTIWSAAAGHANSFDRLAEENLACEDQLSDMLLA